MRLLHVFAALGSEWLSAKGCQAQPDLLESLAKPGEWKQC